MAELIFVEEKPRVSTSEVDRRKAICQLCEYKNGDMCTHCDCLIESKVWSFCPKGEWSGT